MSHPKTRARTAAAVAGLAMAAASAGIASLDANNRASQASPNTTTTVTVVVPATAPRTSGTGGTGGPAALFVPDPTLHPGAINTGLDSTQLCAAGFTTSSIRPPTSYTNKLKELELGDGGTITAPDGTTFTIVGEHLPGTISDYELDHLISL